MTAHTSPISPLVWDLKSFYVLNFTLCSEFVWAKCSHTDRLGDDANFAKLLASLGVWNVDRLAACGREDLASRCFLHTAVIIIFSFYSISIQ